MTAKVPATAQVFGFPKYWDLDWANSREEETEPGEEDWSYM
jgi:hypothetical protein